MTWQTHQVNKQIHVVPVKDLRTHIYGAWCSCKPKQDVKCFEVWVHNAFDQRELKEKDHLQ